MKGKELGLYITGSEEGKMNNKHGKDQKLKGR